MTTDPLAAPVGVDELPALVDYSDGTVTLTLTYPHDARYTSLALSWPVPDAPPTEVLLAFARTLAGEKPRTCGLDALIHLARVTSGALGNDDADPAAADVDGGPQSPPRLDDSERLLLSAVRNGSLAPTAPGIRTWLGSRDVTVGLAELAERGLIEIVTEEVVAGVAGARVWALTPDGGHALDVALRIDAMRRVAVPDGDGPPSTDLTAADPPE